MTIRPALAALLLAVSASPLASQPAVSGVADVVVPAFAGESLSFRARAARVGSLGGARMWVERDESAGESGLWVMHFDFRARIGFVSAEDRTPSWFDAGRGAAVRYVKHERHPLSRHDEDVSIDPATGRWRDADGDNGVSPTDAPLDELSFIYFLRGLTLPEGSLSFDRHFDADRNPVIIRFIGRDTIDVGAGRFRALRVEMRVKDPRRYRGDGTILFDLSDDACRLPLRIESTMPLVGRAVLTLDEYRHPRATCTARIPDTLANRASGNP
ncbi:MAG: DUF3108 domain-containing protein [Gemmatimonadaceae bacterium]|nr:DUF3108 domain-containing protein [Gemmatimonadaceae bacterium]